MRKCSKCSYGADLRLIFMPLAPVPLIFVSDTVIPWKRLPSGISQPLGQRLEIFWRVDIRGRFGAGGFVDDIGSGHPERFRSLGIGEGEQVGEQGGGEDDGGADGLVVARHGDVLPRGEMGLEKALQGCGADQGLIAEH